MTPWASSSALWKGRGISSIPAVVTQFTGERREFSVLITAVAGLWCVSARGSTDAVQIFFFSMEMAPSVCRLKLFIHFLSMNKFKKSQWCDLQWPGACFLSLKNCERFPWSWNIPWSLFKMRTKVETFLRQPVMKVSHLTSPRIIALKNFILPHSKCFHKYKPVVSVLYQCGYTMHSIP